MKGKLVASSEWLGTTKTIRAQGVEVPLAQLHDLVDRLGLPVTGLANVDLAIDVPNGSAAQINGKLDFRCIRCRIGDDVAKLQLGSNDARSNAFGGGGLDFGHLDVDQLDVAVAIANGHADLTKFVLRSPDLVLEITAHVELASSLEDSQLLGCIRFKGTPALAQRDPKLTALLGITGAPQDTDGMYTIRLDGSLAAPKRLGQICH